jgi:hypothetical protein
MNPLLSRTLLQQDEQSFAFKSADGLILPIVPSISGFSLSFWWRPTNITQEHALFNWESTFDRNGISFRQNNGGALAVVGSNASSTVFTLTNGSVEIPRTFVFLTLTYNSAKQIRIYRNGSQILSGSGTITSNGTSPALGRRSHSNSMHANGLMKNFTFQNTDTAWTQAQIDELYKRNVAPAGALQWEGNMRFTDRSNANAMSVSGKTNFSNTIPLHLN